MRDICHSPTAKPGGRRGDSRRLARLIAGGNSLSKTIAAATSVTAGTASGRLFAAASPSRFSAASEPRSDSCRNRTMPRTRSITSK